jgi:hypothetical protein
VIGAVRAADTDQSTPKATALTFAKALEAGDADAAKKIAIGTDQDQQVLASMCEFTKAVKTIHESAVKKYADKADEVIGGLTLDSAKALEDAEIKEDGDSATVSYTKPQPSSMYLKKVDGKWMVNLTDTLKNAQGAGQDVVQFQSMLKDWAGAVNETASEIDEGKYAQPTDARDALSGKMLTLKAKSSTAPTTEPITQPAK